MLREERRGQPLTLRVARCLPTSACPAGLTYAPDGAYCLRFLATMDLGDMSPEDVVEFVDAAERRISDGDLYAPRSVSRLNIIGIFYCYDFSFFC